MRLRTVLRIARWEVSTGAGSIDRRTAAVGLVGVVIVLGLVPAIGATGGVALDEGLFRVGVGQSHPLHAPAAADRTIAVRPPSEAAFDRGELDVLVTDDRILARGTDKGRAAVAELRTAVERYNDRRMAEEANGSAAFPVAVTIRYVDRDVAEVVGTDGGGGSGGGGGGAGGGGSGGGDGTATDDAGGGGAGDGDTGGGGFGVPGLGGDLLSAGSAAGSPSDIRPPFPFQSLILAFAFVLPLNFVIQAYGSSVLGERINRRGELLLVAPVSRGDVIAGKTLPYFVGTLLVAGAIALLVGGGPLSVLAMVPLAGLFLASTFLGAMFARSFKELTFVTVTVSVFLTAFAFVPAIFADVSSVALISPLTLVVADLAGDPVPAGGIAFATLPATLTAVVLFGLGAGVYREEDMFTQRPVHLKLLDALASRVHRVRSLPLATGLLVPFVFVAELLAVAVLFALPGRLSIPLLLAAVAVIEELAKGLPVLAGFAHARYPRTDRYAVLAGAAAGLGFFLAEKLTLMVQLVGLPELRTRSGQLGEFAFQTGLGGEGLGLALALLLAPLALHAVTATLSALGARRGGDWFAVGLVAAILVHLGYNLAVVVALV